MQLLFRLVTSAGWNDVLAPLLTAQPPVCDPHFRGSRVASTGAVSTRAAAC